MINVLAYGKMHCAGRLAPRRVLFRPGANYWGYFFEDTVLMLLRKDITKQDCDQLEQVHFNQRWKNGKWGTKYIKLRPPSKRRDPHRDERGDTCLGGPIQGDRHCKGFPSPFFAEVDKAIPERLMEKGLDEEGLAGV